MAGECWPCRWSPRCSASGMRWRSTTLRNCSPITLWKISASSDSACRWPGWDAATQCLNWSRSDLPAHSCIRSITAIFKGLLFFGAGNVYLQAQTGDIEQMGGFARVIPVTAVAFLVGAISICGLPPFNGFVSEFILYKSFFRGGDLLSGYAPLAMLFAAVGLAFVGGLAVACFTKLYGIVFLGQNRSGSCLPPAARAGLIFGHAAWLGGPVRIDRCFSGSRPAPCCAGAGRACRRCSSAARLGVTARPIADCLRACFWCSCVRSVPSSSGCKAEPACASARLGVAATRP